LWYTYCQAVAESRELPKGPRGERRLADVVDTAVKVMRIATGQEPDDREDAPSLTPGQQLGRLGGAARAKKLSPERRKEIARKGAAKRWGNT